MHLSSQFFIDYPAWFLLLCLLCGAAYAFIGYFREKKINSAVSNKLLVSLLAFFRFLAVSVLAFFLLNPYLKSRQNEEEKPIVIIAQDNSMSASAGLDTLAYKQAISDLKDALQKKYDVRTYTFAESLKENNPISFSEKSTDISEPLNELQHTFQNLNVGAIILATDGIYNTGSNPVYVKNDLNAPYYMIALGDTIPKKDIRISSVLHNDIVYLKDKFTVAVNMNAVFCNGLTTSVKISEITQNGSQVKGEKTLNIQSDNAQLKQEFQLEADAPGMRHYRVSTSPVDGEFTTENNVFDFYLEVLDARQKILLLAAAPHPDIAAIKQSLETNQNYEIETALAKNFTGNVADFNLIILHNLPSDKFPVKLISDVISSKHLPVLFITGTQTNISAFNTMQNLLKITNSSASANEASASVQASFNLFTLEQTSMDIFPKLPPLVCPYGQYTVSAASQILFYQKIGTVNTKYPLAVYSLPGNDKLAIFCGENIFKWRMYNYLLTKNQDAVNELLTKTVQYLSAKTDNKQFRTELANSKNVLNENEQLNFHAELYNDSYELINEPEATLKIYDSEQKEYPFQFSKSGKSYELNAGYFPEGNYTFTASVNYNGKTLKDAGAFSIAPVKLELMQTTANHKILHEMASSSGGKMIQTSEISQLEQLISEKGNVKPVLHEKIKTLTLIHLRWICFLILGLLTAEWFIRKYHGSY